VWTRWGQMDQQNHCHIELNHHHRHRRLPPQQYLGTKHSNIKFAPPHVTPQHGGNKHSSNKYDLVPGYAYDFST
jgi:hypothetical protein